MKMRSGPHRRIVKVAFVGGTEDLDPEEGNSDVHVLLSDGSLYSFLVATPKNIEWCMENEATDFYFGFPPLLVRRLSQECVQRAIEALIEEEDGRWLEVYGSRQEGTGTNSYQIPNDEH